MSEGRKRVGKYRKKPVVIEAEQFFSNSLPFPEGVIEERNLNAKIDEPARTFHIETLEGVHIVSPGDWIITGIKGEKYPCKPDIFKATYEKVTEDK